MFNPNRKQKIESEEFTYSKEPIAMSDPKTIQKNKPTNLQSFKNKKKILDIWAYPYYSLTQNLINSVYGEVNLNKPVS